jgi:hypothetical protein
MVKSEIKHTYRRGPPQKVGYGTLPGHGNTEHPYTRHPNRSEPTTTGSAQENTTPELTPERGGGRKSNRRKKTMNKKRKTAKKRKTKKARKTRRRKVAGTGVGKTMYREVHKKILGRPSRGQEREEMEEWQSNVAAHADAAKERKKNNDVILNKIRQSKDYTEMHEIWGTRNPDIKFLVKGGNYVEFQGADAKPVLKQLGGFKEVWRGPYNRLGQEIKLIFEKKTLEGFGIGGGDGWLQDNTSLRGRVFKVNSGDILSESKDLPKDLVPLTMSYVGGRKRKTRKARRNKRV